MGPQPLSRGRRLVVGGCLAATVLIATVGSAVAAGFAGARDGALGVLFARALSDDERFDRLVAAGAMPIALGGGGHAFATVHAPSAAVVARLYAAGAVLVLPRALPACGRPSASPSLPIPRGTPS